MTRSNYLTKKQENSLINPAKLLVDDISQLIEEARNNVAREYNAAQVLLCWLIGKRIDEEILKYQRAEYGENIVVSLVEELSLRYGRGYSRPNIFRMIKFSKIFPDRTIVSTLSRQLSWSHFIMICAIDDEIKRNFYAYMCRTQHWSVRSLKKQLDSRLFERTSLSKQPDDVIESQLLKLQNHDEMTADLIFKDPYFINFINGQDYQSEGDLETLILNNITEFLQELGSDFCFRLITPQRQKDLATIH